MIFDRLKVRHRECDLVAVSVGQFAYRGGFEGALQGLEAVHERAHVIREQVSDLAYADGRAYGVVLDALRMEPGEARTHSLDEAMSGAIGVPMQVLELASEVAMLAADVAETGNRNLEGDALAGSLLAEAAARSAATLAQLNASMLSRSAVTDAHLERLRPALARATRARERAVTAYTHV